MQAEAARLRAPEAIETTVSNRERARLEARRLRVVDAYVDGLFGDGAEAKVIRDQRIAEVDAALAKLSAEALIVEVPTIDWAWAPRRPQPGVAGSVRGGRAGPRDVPADRVRVARAAMASGGRVAGATVSTTQ